MFGIGINVFLGQEAARPHLNSWLGDGSVVFCACVRACVCVCFSSA